CVVANHNAGKLSRHLIKERRVDVRPKDVEVGVDTPSVSVRTNRNNVELARDLFVNLVLEQKNIRIRVNAPGKSRRGHCNIAKLSWYLLKEVGSKIQFENIGTGIDSPYLAGLSDAHEFQFPGHLLKKSRVWIEPEDVRGVIDSPNGTAISDRDLPE